MLTLSTIIPSDKSSGIMEVYKTRDVRHSFLNLYTALAGAGCILDKVIVSRVYCVIYTHDTVYI